MDGSDHLDVLVWLKNGRMSGILDGGRVTVEVQGRPTHKHKKVPLEHKYAYKIVDFCRF